MHRSILLVVIISINISLISAFFSCRFGGRRWSRNLNTSNCLPQLLVRCTFHNTLFNMMSSIPDDTTTSTTEDVKLSDSLDMLGKWIEHDDHSYHLNFLNPTQSNKIRIALVEWYRANRRKLPWRGDAGPYDGSTAGYAASASSSNNGKGKKRKDEGELYDVHIGIVLLQQCYCRNNISTHTNTMLKHSTINNRERYQIFFCCI